LVSPVEERVCVDVDRGVVEEVLGPDDEGTLRFTGPVEHRDLTFPARPLDTMSERPDHARIGQAKRPGFSPITYETHHPGDAFLGDAPIQWGPVHDSFTSVT
jgi:hypothetical protein